MQNPLVAIVILNWNGKKYLEMFLPFVMQSTYTNYKVVVADNGSTDGSVKWVKEKFTDVKLILLEENFGFAKGYNLALEQVEADYFILLNSDVKVSPNWIEPLVALAATDSKIAACQPKLLAYNNPINFEYAGANGGWLDAYGYPFARGRVFDHCEADEGQYDDESPVFWASGAALFIKSSAFKEVGGFDAYFFAHQEEIDLCWRLQLAGYKIYSCPRSVVYHVGGGTLPKGNSLKTYLNFRNNHIMLYKNLYGWRRIYVIGLRTILDAVSAVKALVGGDLGYLISVASAHLSFMKWFFTERKKTIFPPNKRAPLNGFFRGNIAWEHFVKGKKKFSEIVTKEP